MSTARADPPKGVFRVDARCVQPITVEIVVSMDAAVYMRVDAKLFSDSMEAVWQRVKPEADAPLVASLPRVLHPSAPYQRADGTNLECNVIVAGGMLPPEPDSRQCRFEVCERSVASGALRVHIACHVLKINEQHPNHQCEPCGYCGDSTSGCIATITETSCDFVTIQL